MSKTAINKHRKPKDSGVAPHRSPPVWRVDLAAQYQVYAREIEDAVARVLRSGRYVLGPEGEAFEREFAAYLRAPHVIGVSNGTSAITMALKALGVKAGSEVITTPFTAVPTIGAIIEAGAVPVFVDIDPDTWLIDCELAAAAINERTSAIVPVHMFGNVVDIPGLRRRLPRSLPIVEDAAQAHGSRLHDRMAGTLGDLATFSFYPTKNLGCYGDGGAIVANDHELAQRLRMMRNHGMQDKDTCLEAGTNSRLDELQAAILRAKLPHLDEMNAARQHLCQVYLERLPPDLFIPQRATAGAQVNIHLLQLRFRGKRDELAEFLASHGIQTNVYYAIPHHLQPAFARLGYRPGDLPEIERLCKESIALPLYPEMSLEVIERVTDAIRKFSRPGS